MKNFRTLSRAEMKNVLGGEGGGGVKCTYSGSRNSTSTCSLDLDTCQDIADYVCEQDDTCDDASCKEE